MKSNLTKWKSAVAKLVAVAIVAVAVALLPVAPVSAASAPSLSKSSRNILIGKTYDLNVKNQIKGSTYAWTTSNKAIATVNKNGLVKAVKAGKAVITCTVTAGDDTFTLTCNVTSVKGALTFSIKNKVTALNVGQVYDVNRAIKPSTSNDKTTWTSSDTSIAKPDKNGKFTALKAGTVTITGTTVSGKSDSMTVKVVDEAGTVTTQAELEALLGTGVQTITLKTTAKLDVTIPAGTYSGTKLIVNAPNSDVHNSGVFAAIDVVAIAENSWYEDAVGNLLTILADKSRVVVSEKAKVSIMVTAEGAKLVVENEGQISEFVVAAPADVEISGDSSKEVPVTVAVPGITVTSSVPLNVASKAKMDLVLLPGAEKSTVSADSEANVPDISGDVKLTVTIDDGTNKTTKVVEGQKIEDTDTDTPVVGPVVTPNPTVTPSIKETVDLTNHTTTFELTRSYKELSYIIVTYNKVAYIVDGTTLDILEAYLDGSDLAKLIWKNTVDTTKTYNTQTVRVYGTKGSMTKTVSFIDGKLAGKSFDVTVGDGNTVVAVSKQSGKTISFTKDGDYKLIIGSDNAGVVFAPKF